MMLVTVSDIQAYESVVDQVLHTEANIQKFQTSVSLRTIKSSTEIHLNE